MMIDEELFLTFSKVISECSSLEECKRFANSLSYNKFKSKHWLVENIAKNHSPKNTLILGSWYQMFIPYYLGGEYTFVDTDSSVCHLNKVIQDQLYPDLKITQMSIDAKDYLSIIPNNKYDLIINTSCEHMDFDMEELVCEGPLYALQSNDYFEIEEHINCKKSLKEFKLSTGLNNILYSGEMKMEKYTRYMVIGYLK